MNLKLSLVLTLGLALAACGDDDERPDDGDDTRDASTSDAGARASDSGVPADAGARPDAAAPSDAATRGDGGEAALPDDEITPGAAPTSSGVSSTKLIPDLTDAEAEQLCLFESAVFKSNLKSRKAYCLSNIWELCESELERCLRSTEPEDALAEDWQCELASVEDYYDGETCTATVAEFEACVTAMEASDQAFFAAASCPASGEPERPEPPSACQPLATKCPDLL